MKAINLVKFGMETLGYTKEHMANNYFKKKFNEFWGLPENNNTGTEKEIMKFAKEKASKKSKLFEWYNPKVEALLKDVFVSELEDIEREKYEYVPKTKPKKPKEEKIKSTDKKKEELEKTDKELLESLGV